MTEYVLAGWQLSDLTIAGPNPFSSAAIAQTSAVGASSFTINSTAAVQIIHMEDNDTLLTDADGGQNLTVAMTFDGHSYHPGLLSTVETEYSYIVRPAGSSDPADNIKVYALEFEGVMRGIASDSRLLAGVTYNIVAIDSNDPSVAYSAMALCFEAQTRIATARGPVAAGDLRPGDLVQSCDNGLQELLWAGRWRRPGLGRGAPVLFAAGSLDNERALIVSPQHRVVICPRNGPMAGQEVLIAAKALIGLPGVRRAPRVRADWVHLYFARHQILLAEGARAESLLPGQQVLSTIEPTQAQALRSLIAASHAPQLPARPILPPGKALRARASRQTKLPILPLPARRFSLARP